MSPISIEPRAIQVDRPVRGRWRTHRARIVTIALPVLFGCAVGVGASPGRMSSDSLAQIQQVIAGEYTDWHAPLLLLLWRPFWLLGAGPGWVMTAAVVTFTLGLYGILRAGLRRAAAAIATIIITLLPQVLGWVIYFGRDMWFMAFFLVASAALAKVLTSEGRARRAACFGLVVAVWLMLAARQNAAPACAVLVFAMCWSIYPTNAYRPGTRGTLVRVLKASTLSGLVVIVLFGSQALMRRAFDVRVSHIEQAIYIYDLAAISVEEGEVLLDREAFPAQDLAVLKKSFDASSFEPLVFGPNAIIPYPVTGDAVEALQEQWIDALLSHPLSYLEERATVWLRQISIAEPSRWIVHPGIDPNEWGYAATFPAIDDGIQRYVRFFASNDRLAGGVVHLVWIYLLVIGGGLWYLRSASPRRRSLGWVCAAALAYQASLFFGLMGTGYRFNVPCVVLGLAVGVVAALDGVGAVRRRRGDHVAAPAEDIYASAELPGDAEDIETDGRPQDRLESPAEANTRPVP